MKKFRQVLSAAVLMSALTVPSFASGGILLADRATTVDANGILLADSPQQESDDKSFIEEILAAIAGILLAD